jgi:hypothetical protein
VRDEEYLTVLARTLLEIEKSFGSFDVCVYQGGCDVLEIDR